MDGRGSSVVRWAKGFGIGAVGLVLGLMGFVLWWSLYPAFYYLVGPSILGLLWLAADLAYLSLLAVFWYARRRDGGESLRPRLRWWGIILAVFLGGTTAIIFKLPMRVGFSTIRPELERALAGRTAESFDHLGADISSLLYQISAERTNDRLKWNRERGLNTNRVLFVLADDSEAAFIYSPSAIEDLVFNSGSAGHLSGNWYWMKED